VRNPTVSIIRILTVLEAASFFLFGVQHVGVSVPLGFVTLSEPFILPATIVESIAGCALGLAAVALFRGASWAWTVAVFAHVVALAGVLLGMAALNAGRGPRTVTNDVYHRIMLVALLTNLVLLWRSQNACA
jgi:hypothetical protein